MTIKCKKTDIAFRIVNVVATATLNGPVDLHKVHEQFPEKVLYEPTACHPPVPAYFKSEGMEGKVSIFPSGKMISVGTKSETKAVLELELVTKFLVEKGSTKPVQLDSKIQNIVVVTDYKKSIDLESLCENPKVIYEPEQFPGAILRFEKPFKASILMFASGKVVITGLKNSTQIEPTIQLLKKLVESNQRSFSSSFGYSAR